MPPSLPVVRPSRREANRAATRTAIVDAAYDLVTEHGADALTVEAVAQRANISRRTFFNYFTSLEEALTDPLADLLHAALAAFEQRPTDEPILVSVAEAFGEVFTADRLPRLAQQLQRFPDNRIAHRHFLEQWHTVEEQVRDTLAARLPGSDPLLVRTLAATTINALQAVVSEWMTRLVCAGEDLAPHLPALHTDVARAFGYLADGFRHHLPEPA